MASFRLLWLLGLLLLHLHDPHDLVKVDRPLLLLQPEVVMCLVPYQGPLGEDEVATRLLMRRLLTA